MPRTRADALRWNAPAVAKLMARKHIPHREELARRIRKPANSVRRSFDEEWDGEATGPIAVAIARELKVDSRKLIQDPRFSPSADNRERRSGTAESRRARRQ